MKQKPKLKRNARIYEAWLLWGESDGRKGHSTIRLAKAYNVSTTRIYQIIQREIRRQEKA